MNKVVRGILSWTVVNGLFMWAVVSACVFGSVVGYNFMVWITGVMCVFCIIGYMSLYVIKDKAPEQFESLKEVYGSSWNVNRYIDIFYDAIIIGIMLFGGFLGIASVYLVTMFVQNLNKSLLEDTLNPSTVMDTYDDSILDRIGIDE